MCLCSYDASLCRLPQQSSKGDDRRHAGTVEEEKGGHTLEAHAVLKVTQIERSFPLDVQYQTAEQPDHGTQQKKRGAKVDTLWLLHDHLKLAGMDVLQNMENHFHCFGKYAYFLSC